MNRIKLALVTVALAALPGCAILKPAIRTVDDLAVDLCARHFADVMGISLRDAAKAYCKTRKALDPFVEALLSAQETAGAQSAEVQGVTLPDEDEE